MAITYPILDPRSSLLALLPLIRSSRFDLRCSISAIYECHEPVLHQSRKAESTSLGAQRSIDVSLIQSLIDQRLGDHVIEMMAAFDLYLLRHRFATRLNHCPLWVSKYFGFKGALLYNLTAFSGST